jgi:hypothetical protein
MSFSARRITTPQPEAVTAQTGNPVREVQRCAFNMRVDAQMMRAQAEDAKRRMREERQLADKLVDEHCDEDWAEEEVEMHLSLSESHKQAMQTYNSTATSMESLAIRIETAARVSAVDARVTQLGEHMAKISAMPGASPKEVAAKMQAFAREMGAFESRAGAYAQGLGATATAAASGVAGNASDDIRRRLQERRAQRAQPLPNAPTHLPQLEKATTVTAAPAATARKIAVGAGNMHIEVPDDELDDMVTRGLAKRYEKLQKGLNYKRSDDNDD